MTAALQFPCGPVAIPEPTAAQLHDSALAWLALAQQQVGTVRYFVQYWSERSVEGCAALDTLGSQLDHIRRALTEAGAKGTP